MLSPERSRNGIRSKAFGPRALDEPFERSDVETDGTAYTAPLRRESDAVEGTIRGRGLD